MTEAAPIQPLTSPEGWQRRAIHECGEPLVPLSTYRELVLRPQYFLQHLPGSTSEIWLRHGVAQRLLAVSHDLPPGLHLVVFDGWRSTALQAALFTRYRETIQRAQPSLHGEDLRRAVSRYVSEPSQDPLAPSPHLTGGAVDLSLADGTGTLLPMGTDFDAFSPEAAMTAFEDLLRQDRFPRAPDGQPDLLARAALRNRRTLFAAMTAHGFSAYSEEWWHFDFGNQFWAACSGRDALYGPVLAPPVSDVSTPAR